jgi:hypothetical protein
VFAHDKVMFEIYREGGYDRRYRVVFFTELDEHNKEQEIARAIAGEHYYEGYLRNESLPEAKRVIRQFIDRLNDGQAISVAEVDDALAAYKA